MGLLGSFLVHPPRYGVGAAAVPYQPSLPTYIRITDIDETGHFRPNPRVSVDSPISGSFVLKDGDLVVARTGASVGKSYRYRTQDGELVFAGFLIKVRPDPRLLDPRYLSHVLQSKPYWDWVASESTRSGQPGINAQQLARFPVDLPDIQLQRDVADQLADVDTLSSSLERLIAKKRAVKQGMMQELLTCRTRLPGFHGKWGPSASFDEICIRSAGFWGVSKRSADARHRVRVITAGDITPRGRIKGASRRYFTNAQVAKAQCHSDDIVITSSGNGLGKTAYVDVPRDLAASNFVRILRPRSEVSGAFLAQVMWTHSARETLDSHTAMSAYPNLMPSFFAEKWIPRPPIDEQLAIAAVLQDADAEIEALQLRLEATRAIKQGMMQELLTGRTRLPVKEDAI